MRKHYVNVFLSYNQIKKKYMPADMREAIRDRHPLDAVGAAAGAIAEAGATGKELFWIVSYFRYN